MTLTIEQQEELKQLSRKYHYKRGALLPILHRIQEEQGFLAEDVLADVAELLGLSPVDVFETASFYTLFHLDQVGRNVVLICNCLSCYILEAEDIVSVAEKHLDIKVGQNTPDGQFTLQTTSCLGACDQGPVMLVNGELHGNLTPAKVRRVLSQYAED